MSAPIPGKSSGRRAVMSRRKVPSRLAFEEKHRRLRRRARAGIDTLLATVDILLDADREAPIASLYKDVREEDLREAAADCRAFARLEGHEGRIPRGGRGRYLLGRASACGARHPAGLWRPDGLAQLGAVSLAGAE